MSLPPGFMDELRSRTSLAQVVGRKVTWDQRKSNQSRGDLWAPCPFHHEKTPSFHVDDRKGFYYCFGCHEKGDAVNFVMATENVEFIEAVRILADEAGLAMPERDPRAAEKTDRRARLIEVCEAALRFFGMQLRAGGGAAARAYFSGRGLDDAACARWDLGFAPDGWRGLYDHLTAQGVAEDLILAAGLARRPERGGQPYDVFRNRIVFPIRDPRGRCVAFGGRAMDPSDNAKYLNSPETEIFDKGRMLYNHAPAREAAGKGAPLILAEGYMDVIALSEAGFGATVAPLGTAITEPQLQLLWRIHPEPAIALDGDTAGQRAALRVVDLALPLLEAGRSLRFCLMPAGQDPDDLLRAGGPAAMEDVLAASRPMVDLLWQRATEGRVFDSPERRAALDADLRAVLGRIRDGAVKRHYGDAFKELRWKLFRPRGPDRPDGRGRAAWRKGPEPGTGAARVSDLAQGGDVQAIRETVVLALILKFPALLPRFEAALARISFAEAGRDRAMQALLAVAAPEPGACRDAVERAIGVAALEKLLAARHLAILPALRGDDPDLAAQCLAEELAKLTARHGAERELVEALEDIARVPDEALTWRLRKAREAIAAAERAESEDRSEIERAANGARLKKDEKDALDGLLRRIGFGGES
ncbi:DNA primase [Palleronia sediminis]|uniref:DNA primase n=1 Tax=Palleronia sediminis TaxID=2547833 RepID=A0A4R6ANP7_9RHOB|nr:DNA primase [Palleronia sediminis]TDL84208.1 DNA primase [Palleronia sediminis]